VTLAPLPTLDELVAAPGRVGHLPPEVAQELLFRLAPLQEALRLRALGAFGSQNGGHPEAPDGDRLLTVEEAARKLGVSKDWIYRRARTLPFVVRLGARLRCSEQGIERWCRQRQGK
jgi:excisionase family DNA binding protein